MPIRSPRIALLLLWLVCLVWGVEFVLVDLAVEQLPTHAFNALRFGVAAVAIVPLWLLSRESLPPQLWGRLLATGLGLGLILFVAYYTQTEGLLHTSVSNAGFITSLNVPLVPLLGVLLWRQHAAPAVWLGIGAATAGLYLLTGAAPLALNRGDGLTLICAFAFALHILVTGRYAGRLPILPLSLVQLLAVAVYSALAQWLVGEPTPPGGWSATLWHPAVIAGVLVAGLLGSAFATWAQTASQRLLPAHKVALVFAAEPVIAHLTAWLVLGETLGPAGLIGAVLILAGMLVAELGDRPQPLELKPLDQSVAAAIPSDDAKADFVGEEGSKTLNGA